MKLNELRVSRISNQVLQTMLLPAYAMETAAPIETILSGQVLEQADSAVIGQYNLRTVLDEAALETAAANAEIEWMIADGVENAADVVLRRVLLIRTIG
ncbi:hypothetical protein [Falsibacillus albus]|uniref:Uncharacterized protein n=1 Tax=Falsibacillus albus TaxID=2478915 RepID=A0A3L7K1S4_9BACI|nr:hypothetical protein [Falsibacillus albus]RLQ96304.1 hypothetical protein D9X91_08450 [Falsibacillus albus]